jgi:plasmid stability protein
MPNLSIKDVPESWAQALRQRAERNHRSLQGELMCLLEQAVSAGPSELNSAMTSSPSSTLSSSAFNASLGQGLEWDRLGRPITRRGSKTIEQIYAEHLRRFPSPITEGPMSVDIIRQDRDSR